MTDKQIIYNCPHISHTDWGTYACKLYNPRDKNCLVAGGNCASNVGCPYKQRKLKEQECERLKEQLTEMISQSALLPKFFGLTADEITNMLKQLDQLKAENKHLNDLLNQALKDYEKARETLTEIKEIAENVQSFVDINLEDDVYTEMDKILQKISEVEDG